MKYMVLLIGEGSTKPWSTMTEEEQAADMGKFEAFDAACAARDGVQIISGEALAGPDSATVMRTDPAGSTTLTEGPYAEAIEGLGGFYVVEAPDLDVLVSLLGNLPAYDIEIRPVINPYE